MIRYSCDKGHVVLVSKSVDLLFWRAVVFFSFCLPAPYELFIPTQLKFINHHSPPSVTNYLS